MSERPAWARPGKWLDRRKGAKVLIPGVHRRKYRPRRVVGREPEGKYRPMTIARFDGYRLPRDPVAARWYLTILCSRGAGDWINCKLWAGCQVELKANYWIGWTTAGHRMHARADARVLEELRPMLHYAVSRVLQHELKGATAAQIRGAACLLDGHDMRGALPFIGRSGISRARRAEEEARGSRNGRIIDCENFKKAVSDAGALPYSYKGKRQHKGRNYARGKGAPALVVHSPDAMVRLDEQAGLLVVTQGDGARARSVAYPDGVTESVEDLI